MLRRGVNRSILGDWSVSSHVLMHVVGKLYDQVALLWSIRIILLVFGTLRRTFFPNLGFSSHDEVKSYLSV